MPTRVPSAEVLTRRGLLLFGLIWQGLWLASDTNLWPGRQSAPHEDALIALIWLTWIVLAIGLIPSRIVVGSFLRVRHVFIITNVLALTAAAAAISINSMGSNTNDWLVSAALFNLAAGMAGILIQDPRQWWWVAGVVISEAFIFIFLGLNLAIEISVNSAILYPLYAMAIGVAAASSQLGLMRRARAADGALQETVLTQLRARKIREANEALAKRRALIHESVLNTLTAIARGGLASSEISTQNVREKAAESASVLRSLISEQKESDQPQLIGLLDQLGDLLQECAARGMRVDIKGNVGGVVPESIHDQIIAALREVLINALRHSRASEISIDFMRVSSSKFKVVIKDNGIGFDQVGRSRKVTSGHMGLGLRHILSRDLQAVNVHTLISSTVGSGTEVTIEFKDGIDWWTGLVATNKTPTSIFVIPVVVGGITYTMVNFVLTWTQYDNNLINSFAMIMVLILAVAIAITSLYGSIPWYVVISVAVVAPVIYWLEGQAQDTGVSAPWGDWTSEGIAALFFIVSAAGPWWAWIAVAASWLFFQGGFPEELIAPGFGLIVAGAVLGRSLRSVGRTREGAILSTTQSQIQSDIAELGTAKSLQKFSTAEILESLEFLERVARGEINFHSRASRHKCAVIDSYLRNILVSHATEDSLLKRVATDAFHNQAVLVIHSEATLWDCEDQLELGLYCARILQQMDLADSARCTFERISPDLVIDLVVHIDVNSNFDTSVIHSQPYSTRVSEFFHEADGSMVYMWQAASPELVSP